MGSGAKGAYSGTRGSSQPYAPTYEVMPDMKELDIKAGVYDKKTGYTPNPTATELNSAIRNNTVYLEGKKANGNFTYVINEKGQLIFGKRSNPLNLNKRSPHPMLIGGKNPKVQCAGMIDIRNGKIYNINQNSGHYKPNERSMEVVEKILSSLPKQVFNRKSKWRKK
jgi:hypothetical protein